MFTGLIEAVVPVTRLETLEDAASGARLILPRPTLAQGLPPWEPVLGESIAISGCCLTVAAIEADGSIAFDLSSETLDCTWFSGVQPGRMVNLERSVRLEDRLGGHLVSGHVDGRGSVTGSVDSGDGGRLFTFEVEEGFERYLVSKGSVAIDGISLTVVNPREHLFDVAIIPETIQRTSLGSAEAGAPVHLEADMIGKWVERLLKARADGS